jgi:hypothetical protein
MNKLIHVQNLRKKIESKASASIYPVYWGNPDKINDKKPLTFFLDEELIAEPIGWAADECRASQIVRLDSDFQGYKPGRDFKHITPHLYRVNFENFAFSAWLGQ